MPEITSGSWEKHDIVRDTVATASRQGQTRSCRDGGSENVSSNQGLVLIVRVIKELQKKRHKWS